MHTYLICGGTKLERDTWIEQKLHDLQVAVIDQVSVASQNPSIGIADIREFEKRLSLVPLSGALTVGLVKDAHLLTIEAQQALLKTLEEPPPRAKIILEIQNSEVLLPTILSRSTITRVQSVTNINSTEANGSVRFLSQLPQLPGERLKAGDTLGTTRTEINDWIATCISEIRNEMITRCLSDSTGHSDSIRYYMNILKAAARTQKYLIANVSPKLCMDMFLLSLPQKNLIPS